jgi:cytochrome c
MTTKPKLFPLTVEMPMSHQVRTKILAGVLAGAGIFFFSASAFAEETTAAKVDAVAAKKLARTDHCLRCHAIGKKKEGPSYQAIAYKYKDQADAQEKLVKHITSGDDMVKLSDGHKEQHKFDQKTSPEQINNLVRWILAQ